MKSLYYYLLALLLTASLQAKEINEADLAQMAKLLMKNKPLSSTDKQQLAIISLHHYKRLKEHILVVKLGGTDMASKSASDALRKLKNQVERTDGASTFGAETIWFLMIDERKYSSLPLISKIEKNSPASVAGLKIGDVIHTCAGINIKGEDSRNNFTRLIRLWPKDTPIKLEVRRSHHHTIRNPSEKKIKKTIKVTLK